MTRARLVFNVAALVLVAAAVVSVLASRHEEAAECRRAGGVLVASAEWGAECVQPVGEP